MNPRQKTIDDHVGRRIAALRRAAGRSQLHLATEVEIAPSTLGQHEKGVCRTSSAKLYLIAQALGAPLEAFFEDLPPEAPRGEDE